MYVLAFTAHVCSLRDPPSDPLSRGELTCGVVMGEIDEMVLIEQILA